MRNIEHKLQNPVEVKEKKKGSLVLLMEHFHKGKSFRNQNKQCTREQVRLQSCMNENMHIKNKKNKKSMQTQPLKVQYFECPLTELVHKYK